MAPQAALIKSDTRLQDAALRHGADQSRFTFESGQFQLDDLSRTLTIRGRDIVLQPKVFDLLLYLVRHRSRVVSKDELLDEVWPGVTVTDNSLQRAVSALRSLLREEHMETAVRTFPRSGYRFGLETDAPPDRRPVETRRPANDDARNDLAACEAVAQQRWQDADQAFERMDTGRGLDGDALDQWALVQHCLGQPSQAIALMTRAIRKHFEARQPAKAGANAALLSLLHLDRGENSVAQGWLAFARDLLTVHAHNRETGYVMLAASRMAARSSNFEHALDMADRAHDIGREFNDPSMEALGLVYRGFYRLCLGNPHDGMVDQNHAGALAMSHKLDPLAGTMLYANILLTCRALGDWARGNEWAIRYQSFCDRDRIALSAHGQLHLAEILMNRGSLKAALENIQSAIARLQDDAPCWLGDAWRVLGDTHAAIGNSAEASAAYDKGYGLGWSPQGGHAILLSQRKDIDKDIDIAAASLDGSRHGRGSEVWPAMAKSRQALTV